MSSIWGALGPVLAAGLAVYLLLVLYCWHAVRMGAEAYPRTREAVVAANQAHDRLQTDLQAAHRHPFVQFARQAQELGPYEQLAKELGGLFEQCRTHLDQDAALRASFRGRTSAPDVSDVISALSLRYLPQAIEYRSIHRNLDARHKSLAGAREALDQFDGRKDETGKIREHVLEHLEALESACAQCQSEIQAEIAQHTPQGLHGLAASLQETGDVLARAHARLALSAPQDWQTAIDVDRICAAREAKLQACRQALGQAIAQRERTRQKLAQVAQALDTLATDLASSPSRGASAQVDDIREQVEAWRTQLRTLRRAPGSPQAYDQAMQRADPLLDEIQQARKELEARRQSFADAEQALAAAQARVAALKKQAFLYPECTFERTDARLDRIGLLIQTAGQLLSSQGTDTPKQVKQKAQSIGLELERIENQFHAARAQLELLRDRPKPAELRRMFQEIAAMQSQPGFGAAVSGYGSSRGRAETSLQAIERVQTYPEPELSAYLGHSDAVRTYIDEQLGALAGQAQEQFRDLESTLQRIRGYANGWHWLEQDRAWRTVNRQHGENKRLLGQAQDAQELAQKTQLLTQLVDQIPATGEDAARLEQDGQALCSNRTREQDRMQKLQPLTQVSTTPSSRQRMAQGRLQRAQACLDDALRARDHTRAARAIREAARELDSAERLLV